jgi:PAS domain S-box-containing protein
MSASPFNRPDAGLPPATRNVTGETRVVSWQAVAAFGLSFWGLAEIGRLFVYLQPSMVMFWLPAGLYTAMLLLNHPRVWGWFAGAAFLAHVAIGAHLKTSWILLPGFFAANTIQAVLGAWLMRRFVTSQPALTTLREFGGFLGLVVAASPLAGAVVVAITGLWIEATGSFVQALEQWWIGQALAVLLIGTTVLAWQRNQTDGGFRCDRPARVVEAMLTVSALTVVACTMLMVDADATAPYQPLIMSFALWAGLRFGLCGATAVNLWFAGLLGFLTLQGIRAGAADPAIARELITALQSFIAMTALVSIVPAIALRERDRKVKELRESENLFRSTLDALPAAAYTCDPGGRITYFNRQSEIIWGRAPRLADAAERFCGSYRLFRVDGSPVPHEQCWMAVALSTQRFVAAAEIIIERPDGTRRTVLANASPLFDSSRALRGAVNVLTDVTELKDAKQALIANEVLLRQFIKHAPAAVAMYDTEMRYVNASEQWVTQFNLDGRNLIGRPHYDVSPEVPERWRAVHRRVLAGAIESCEEDSFVRPDGETEWLHWDARPWRTPDGEIGGLIMFTQVITERIKMKAALHASEERFRSAMHHSPIGMALVGIDGRFLEVNPALSQISGYTAAELVARDLQSISHPDDLAANLACVREMIERRRESFQMEKRYVHKLGHAVWIQLNVSLVWNADGTPRHFVAQIQDITEKRRAEEQRTKLEAQLRQAQKMEAIGTLAGGIAHDFNNILAGVMGNLQLAELDLPAGHPVAHSVQEAMRASRRARDLVSRILTFSRRSEQLRVPTRLGSIIEETLQLLRATLPATIEIHTDIAADCPPVRCDGAQIHQIILNLGGNAVAAMRERGGQLTICLRHETPDAGYRDRHPQVTPNQVVRLSVRDTGHGMSEAVRERIFEPFFTTKGPGEGTGLGLAVVHGIMQDLGGAVVVESEEGRGTAFDLFFPACNVETATTAPAGGGGTRPTKAAKSSGSGERILVVDDDATVLSVATSILRRDGYRPEPFASPVKALAAFEADPDGYAIVVSDLTMPELTGFELARRIQALNAETPLVIASGYLDEESMAEFAALGLADRLQKPYDVAALLNKVRGVLQRRTAMAVSG